MRDSALAAAELYDARTRQIVADREAIERLVGGKSVLEVGCGTGRVLRWLIHRGASSIVGVEIDEAKLAVARRDRSLSSAPELRLVHAGFLDILIEAEFECVLFAFNVLAEFTTVETRIAALSRARSLLVPEGWVVLVNAMHDFASFGEPEVRYRFSVTEGDQVWDVDLRCRRNRIAQISECEVQYSERASGLSVADRYVNALLTRNELLALYHASGLNVVAEYGSYHLSPVNDDSDVLIHVLGCK